jgi:hypothetical protein
MRTIFNEILRVLIAVNMTLLGKLFNRLHKKRIRNFRRDQEILAEQLEINAGRPILNYGDELKQHIDDAAKAIHSKQFAVTSGSTSVPKRILYPDFRLRKTRFVYIDNLGRCFNAIKIPRKVLYVFSALRNDDSLTGMLLDENKGTPYISGLQAPYRLHRDEAMQELSEKYSPTAIRLWMMVLSNPGIFYSTNPSTLSTFLDALQEDWQNVKALIREYLSSPENFDERIHDLRKRVQSFGWSRRFNLIAESEKVPSYEQLFPGFSCYFCWTGGYVQPFIDRIEARLPPEKYRRIPMYSMSTETVETIADYRDNKVHFLPLGPSVLYEFLPIEAEDLPKNILRPDQLEVGEQYTMVLSDIYGLKRYQTDDVFDCRGFVDGLPDLHFARRRSLEYSFTGEKLTGPQLSEAYLRLRAEYPSIGDEVFFTCIPSEPKEDAVPHYKLIVVGTTNSMPESLAARFDSHLMAINHEYASKRETDRLGPPQLVQCDLAEIVARVADRPDKSNWESQFKFLPLYRRTWESMMISGKAPN